LKVLDLSLSGGKRSWIRDHGAVRESCEASNTEVEPYSRLTLRGAILRVKEDRMVRQLLVMVTLTWSMAGCTPPAQNFRLGIEAVAHFNTAALEALELAQPIVNREALDDVDAAYHLQLNGYVGCLDAGHADCTDPGTTDEWLERWDDRVTGITQGITAIEEINVWVVDANEEAVRWRDARTDDTPDTVRRVCGTLGNLLGAVLRSLRLVNVAYPPVVDTIAELLGPACGSAINVFAREEGGGL